MSGRWISLCCGLDATSCRAMTGRFPPVGRMGGKRSVADHVLELLGEWPREWLMVDSDPAIVEFWRMAFAGELAGARILVHEREAIITGGPWRSFELERRSWRNWNTFAAGSAREYATINFEPRGQLRLFDNVRTMP